MGRPLPPGKQTLEPAQTLARGLGLLPQLDPQRGVLRVHPHVCQHELRDVDGRPSQARRDGLELAQIAPGVGDRGAPAVGPLYLCERRQVRVPRDEHVDGGGVNA